MYTKKLRFVQVGIIVMLIISLLFTGCGDQDLDKLDKYDPNKEVTLKVLCGNEEQFFNRFGNVFNAVYPKIKIEPIDATIFVKEYMEKNPDASPEEMWKALIDEKKPDVLNLDYKDVQLFEELVEEGKLYDLSSVIQQDNVDLEKFVPSITEYLKQKGNGKLYGLMSTYLGIGIFYNRTLFNKYGIPEPTDQMTWSEVIELAKRFPVDGKGSERVYGFEMLSSLLSVSNALKFISGTEGLTFCSNDGSTLTLNTDSWKKVFKQSIDLMKSNACYTQENFESWRDSNTEVAKPFDPYLCGQAAMNMALSNTIEGMDAVTKYYPDCKPFEWGLVTVPIDPSLPDQTHLFYPWEFFAVCADSNHLREAWEFVKYATGEEMTKIQSRKMTGALSTRLEFIKDKDGHSLEAFYKLKPVQNEVNNYKNVPTGFIDMLFPIFDREGELILQGKQTVDEALEKIQEEGQQLLHKCREEVAQRKKMKEQEKGPVQAETQ